MQKGFTLLELMIVVSIMGILSTIALPVYQDRVIRAQVAEVIEFSQFARTSVAEYHRRFQRMPRNNAEAGLPEPERIIGSFVTRLEVREGAVHVTMGHRANRNAHGKIVSFRPGAVVGAPIVPLSWACGKATLPAALKTYGSDDTSLPATFLPIDCRPGPT